MAGSNKVVLYGSPISQPTMAVRWFLAINNIPYKEVISNVTLPRKKRAGYIKTVNPTGRIPSIKDTNGVILYESAAILQYLGNRYNLTDWYPTSLKERGKIDEYLFWHHENTRLITTSYVGLIMRVDVPFKRWIFGTDVLKRRKIVKQTLNIIENKRLNNKQWIASIDKPSIADILCFEELTQLEVWNLLCGGINYGYNGDGTIYMKSNYPNIYQWLLRMRQLPKHDKIHQILTSVGILSQVKRRNTAFNKALQKYQSKL